MSLFGNNNPEETPEEVVPSEIQERAEEQTHDTLRKSLSVRKTLPDGPGCER